MTTNPDRVLWDLCDIWLSDLIGDLGASDAGVPTVADAADPNAFVSPEWPPPVDNFAMVCVGVSAVRPYYDTRNTDQPVPTRLLIATLAARVRRPIHVPTAEAAGAQLVDPDVKTTDAQAILSDLWCVQRTMARFPTVATAKLDSMRVRQNDVEFIDCKPAGRAGVWGVDASFYLRVPQNRDCGHRDG